MQPVQKPLYALGLRLLATMVLATLVMVVKYTAASGVAFPEILFWRQVPSVVLILTWPGAPVIIAAGAVIAWREHLHHRRLPPTAASSAE